MVFRAAEWTTKYINDLPDTAFALVVKGEKDEGGKTVPRTNRNLPHHDANGKARAPFPFWHDLNPEGPD
jgi:hypothetical protein